MNITVLDAKTLGDDLSLVPLEEIGECTVFFSTSPEEVAERISECDVVIINKIKLNSANLAMAKNLKLICVAATGYDNIDVEYCREKGIAVCNVVGYSSHSVAQVTVATVLNLFTHMNEYARFVKCGDYTRSGIANKLSPIYHEIHGKTWGIVGFGNIGREVSDIAEALGCNIVVCKNTPVDDYKCVDISTLCKVSDIITLHTPLNDSTFNLINSERISEMKKNVVLVNSARGAVTDEKAVADAVIRGMIGAFGSDVYSTEPFGEDHPFTQIKDLPNVCLTPHMAWGAYEARVRCLNEIILNIKDFFGGGRKGRVD